MSEATPGQSDAATRRGGDAARGTASPPLPLSSEAGEGEDTVPLSSGDGERGYLIPSPSGEGEGQGEGSLRLRVSASPRLVRADCLAFLASLPDESVDAIVTDPAYSGMNQHMMFGRGRIVGTYGAAENPKWFAEFHDDPDSYRTFLAECRRVLRPDRHLYVMFDSYSLLSLGALVREFFEVKNLIVWDKVRLGMGHYFRRRHELIVFASKGKRKLSRRDLPDVWRFARIHPAGYPTQKPVELFEAMLCGSVAPGEVVCDPFLGSGSSAIAALKRGCRFVGCDVDPEAVAFAERRVSAYLATGADPAQPRSALLENESYSWLNDLTSGARGIGAGGWDSR